MDEIWGGNMTLIEKRIENIMKAMKRAKDDEMKSIWSTKLRELV